MINPDSLVRVDRGMSEDPVSKTHQNFYPVQNVEQYNEPKLPSTLVN